MSVAPDNSTPSLFRQRVEAIQDSVDDAGRGLPSGFLGDFEQTDQEDRDVIHYRHYLWNMEGPLEQSVWVWRCYKTFAKGSADILDGDLEDNETHVVLREPMPPSFAGYVAGVVRERFEEYDDAGDDILKWVQEAGIPVEQIATPEIREAILGCTAELLARLRDKLEVMSDSLNPPLSESDVQEFEERHGIKLPAVYRLYLTCLANGGDVDFLYPLGTFPTTESYWGEYWSRGDRLANPFPLTEEFHAWGDPPDEDDESSSYDDWCVRQPDAIEAAEQDVFGRASNGTMMLRNPSERCYFLVLNGSGTGDVWTANISYDIQTTDWHLVVERRCGFLRWLEEWLDGDD